MVIQAVNHQTAMEWRRGDFVISTDRRRLSLDVVHGFLSISYWATGISREVVARSIENSLCFGLYDDSGNAGPSFPEDRNRIPPQVGFARVVSDLATVAYLGDVFVLQSHRRRGLSKWLMECILQHPALQNLRRWILLTRDAHRLYSQFGFTPVKVPESFMELHRPDVYQPDSGKL